jgi:hypothetical protein
MTDGITRAITQLEAQKAAIETALGALRGLEGETAVREERSAPATRKGGMTPEGKKRLIKALKKRWAAKKAAAALAGAPAPAAEAPARKKGNFTPEGRKRLAEAMKRRWAVKRAASAVKKRGRKKAAEKAANVS